MDIKEIENKLNNILKISKLDKKITVEDIKSAIWNVTENESSFKIIKYFIEYGNIKKSEINQVLDAFNNAWNFFPHKSLEGRSPFEMSKEKEPLTKEEIATISKKYNKKYIDVFSTESPDEETPYAEILSIGNENGADIFAFKFSDEHYRFLDFFQDLISTENEIDITIEDKSRIEEILEKDPYLFFIQAQIADSALQVGEDIEDIKLLYEITIRQTKMIFPIGFIPGKHQLPWFIHENRPYLSFLKEYAMFVDLSIDKKKSIPLYEEIILLNPNDNQGIRSILSTLYLEYKMYDQLYNLASQYKKDLECELVMGNILALLINNKDDKAIKSLDNNIKNMKHIVREIIKEKHKAPESAKEELLTVGGENEAWYYWEQQGKLWTKNKAALMFLKDYARKNADKLI